MKITKLIIRNFRSIQYAEISPSMFNIAVGQNNHGKTNMLEAIEWFYNAKKTLDSDKYLQDQELIVSVEIEFSGVQAALLEMKSEKNRETILKKLGESDKTTLIKTSEDNKRMFLIDGKSDGTGTGFEAALNDFLPKLEYVSTKIKLDDVSKYKSTSPIGQMLGDVLQVVMEKDSKYQAFNRTFNELFSEKDSTTAKELNTLGNSVEKFLSKQFPDDTKVKFLVQPPELEDLLKNFDIEVDDGVKTLAECKGDGMQRAVMLAIIQTFAEYRRKGAGGKSFLFLLDEAELHLHPSAQRALKAALSEISVAGDQVFVNTHSQVLIANELSGQTILKVEKINRTTHIDAVTETERPGIVFDLLGGSPNDLLLPKNFIIVEGQSERNFMLNIIERFYSKRYAGIQILFARGNEERQAATMTAVHDAMLPLVSDAKPIYKERLVVLCDKPNAVQETNFGNFRQSYGAMFATDRVIILPCETLEEYYPGKWKKLRSEIHWKEKVKYARQVANEITKIEFENEMPKIHQALERAFELAFK